MSRFFLKGIFNPRFPYGFQNCVSRRITQKIAGGVKFRTQGREENHNILGVAAASQKFRFCASTSHRQKGHPIAYMIRES